MNKKENNKVCKHLRTACFFPEKVTCKLPNGKEVPHKTIKIVGCLDCNRTWMVDYGE